MADRPIPRLAGTHLLTKVVESDALGQILRARRIASAEPQFDLVRRFDAAGIDQAKLLEAAKAAGPILQGLKGPGIARGLSGFEAEGVVHLVSEFVPGHSLGRVLQRTADEGFPIAVDQALLIADKIVSALDAGYQFRINDERVNHRFVVPQFVWITEEGEVKLIGFGFGEALLAQTRSGPLAETFLRYVAPEARAGKPGKSSDVYSACAILFELLTGERVPTDVSASVISGAQIAHDGVPLPKDLADLLGRGLATDPSARPDGVGLKKELLEDPLRRQLRADDLQPRLLHEQPLPRRARPAGPGDGEGGAAQDRRLQAQGAPAGAEAGTGRGEAGPAAAAGRGADLRVGGAAEVEDRALRRDRDRGGRRRRRWLVPVGQEGGEPAGSGATAVAPPASANLQAAATAMDPAALEALVQKRVEEKLKEIEDARKAEQDPKKKKEQEAAIAALKQQKEEFLKKQEEARQAAAGTVAATPTTAGKGNTAPAPAAGAAPEKPTGPSPEEIARKQKEAAEAAKKLEASLAAAAPASNPPPASTPAVTPPAPAPAPAPAAAAAATKEGDFVDLADVDEQPIAMERIKPDYPRVAKMRRSEGTVILRLTIDEKGKVSKVDVLRKASDDLLNDAAVGSAKEWKYRPAMKDGKKVKTNVTEAIPFKL